MCTMHISEEKPDRTRPGARVEWAFAALLMGLLMAQLDGNIVVAALPAIGADLGAGNAIAGVTASTLLTVTITSAIWGRLGDVVGRRTVFVVSVLIFGVASALCALAWNMPALLGARALQGVGAGGLVVTAVASIGEMFSRDELMKRQIWMTAVFAVSSLAGPPVGGLLAAASGWPSIFWVNLPICALALVLGYSGLPTKRDGERGSMANFDYRGSLLVAIGGTAVVALGSSAEIAGSPLWAPLLVAVIIASAVLFHRVERRAQMPLIPLTLFKIPALARSIATTTLVGVALFGTFTFVPLAIAAGVGGSVAQIGTMLLAMTGGQLLVISTFSILARKYKRMVPWGRISLVMGVAGLGALACVPLLHSTTAIVVAVAGMVLAGAALGLSLQVFTVLGQTSAPRDQIGAAMGTITFVRQLGGTLGVAGFGWLLLLTPDNGIGLTVVLATAAAVLALALFVTPRREHEPEGGAGPGGW